MDDKQASAKIGCVILNYNDFENTAAQVERVKDFACLDAVIVVDNNSSDGSGKRLEKLEDSKISVLCLTENKGYGAGNNAGVRFGYEALGMTHVIIANPDTYFDENCIKALVKVFDRHDEVGVAAATMKDKTDGSQASGWKLLSYAGELMNTGPVCRRVFRPFLRYPASYTKGKRAVYVDAVHGSMLMVDAEKMIICGGYDERVFLYGEENILAWRMKDYGYKTVQLLNVFYQHENSASISKTYKDICRRQKLRHESTMFYFIHYLHIGKGKQIFAKMFFGIVMAEVWLCSKVLGLKW